MTISDYVRDYYIPLMKIDRNIPEVSSFIECVEFLENNKDRKFDQLEKSYYNLVEYIKKNIKDFTCVNQHFNRLRFHIQCYFLNSPIFDHIIFS